MLPGGHALCCAEQPAATRRFEPNLLGGLPLCSLNTDVTAGLLSPAAGVTVVRTKAGPASSGLADPQKVQGKVCLGVLWEDPADGTPARAPVRSTVTSLE